MNQETYQKEKTLKIELENILAKEELFWKQKSRETWLNAGDKNTKFFHNSTNMRRNINKIKQITNPKGTLIEEPKAIAEEAINHFRNTLNNDDSFDLTTQNQLLDNIPRIINQDINKSLKAKFTMEEIGKVLKQMQPDKAPGPDGFPAMFFQRCWEFVGLEVTDALKGIRNSGKLLKEINNTFLVLIPKKDKVESFNDCRPIALCNTIYKLLSKTLANRMQKLLPTIFSKEQTGFVQERSIYDRIIIAQEAIHSTQMNKKPSIFIKLDISKAYDRVN